MAKTLPSRMQVSKFTDAMYERALKASKPPQPLDVVSAIYHRKSDTLRLTLSKGIRVELPRAQIRELAKAAPNKERPKGGRPRGSIAA